MHIAFRADASVHIGSGHIMRCLTLADRINSHYHTKQRAQTNLLTISFIASPLPENLQQKIVSSGYYYQELPVDENNISQESDAKHCLTVLKSLPAVDLMILDHYQLANTWQTLLAPFCENMMVIDDLANRNHQCDFLLDQTFARKAEDYQAYLNKDCLTFIGKDYLLLREEFITSLPIAKARRDNYQKIQNILITMGSMDEYNVCTKVVKSLITLRQKAQLDFTVTIVLGSQAPNLSSLSAFIQSFSWITLVVECQSMAKLILEADLAIGASGTTAWERCSLGLPTIVVITADNQNLVASNLAKQGAIINLGDYHYLNDAKVEHAFLQLSTSTQAYQNMVSQCFDIVKQSKIPAMLDIIMTSIKLSPATDDDKDIIFAWQSNPDIRRFSRNNKPIPYQEHCQWINRAMADNTRHIYLIKEHFGAEQTKNVGMIRFDEINDSEVEISILIAPEMQGKKIALRALFATPKIYTQKTIHAYVHPDNIASQHLFRSANYRQIANDHFILASENNQ